MPTSYRQVKYRAAEGRFDGSLNKMAADGWEVVSIDRVDDLFLVTFSREVQGRLKHDTCHQDDLETVLARNQAVGNRLIHMNSATSSPSNDFVHTLVWEVTDPSARQPQFRRKNARPNL